MEEKLTKLNRSIIEEKIRRKMCEISSGELTYIEALKAFEKIEQLVDQLEPEEALNYQPYCEKVKARVINHLRNQQTKPQNTPDKEL